MNKCLICNMEMNPLFNSYYCPNDCDKLKHITVDKKQNIWYCISWAENIPERFPKEKYLCIKEFEKAKEYISYRNGYLSHLLFLWKVNVKEIGASDSSFRTRLVKDADAYYCSGEVLEKIQIDPS